MVCHIDSSMHAKFGSLLTKLTYSENGMSLGALHKLFFMVANHYFLLYVWHNSNLAKQSENNFLTKLVSNNSCGRNTGRHFLAGNSNMKKQVLSWCGVWVPPALPNFQLLSLRKNKIASLTEKIFFLKDSRFLYTEKTACQIDFGEENELPVPAES